VGGGAIERDGRVLVAATSNDSWFWRAAVLGPGGELQPIPATFEGDIYPAGWDEGGRALGMGYALRSDLWRLVPSGPRERERSFGRFLVKGIES
jgi:hypothetical protein